MYIKLMTGYDLDYEPKELDQSMLGDDNMLWCGSDRYCFYRIYQKYKEYYRGNELKGKNSIIKEAIDGDKPVYISIFVGRDEADEYTNCCILSTERFEKWLKLVSFLFNVEINYTERVDSYTVSFDLNALSNPRHMFMILPMIRYCYEGNSSPALNIMFDMFENDKFRTLLPEDDNEALFALFQFVKCKYVYSYIDQDAFIIEELISIDDFRKNLDDIDILHVQATFLKKKYRAYLDEAQSNDSSYPESEARDMLSEYCYGLMRGEEYPKRVGEVINMHLGSDVDDGYYDYKFSYIYKIFKNELDKNEESIKTELDNFLKFKI